MTPSLVGNKGLFDTTHLTCGSLRTHQNNPILRQMYTKLIILTQNGMFLTSPRWQCCQTDRVENTLFSLLLASPPSITRVLCPHLCPKFPREGFVSFTESCEWCMDVIMGRYGCI